MVKVLVLMGLIMLLPVSTYAGTLFDDFEKENDLWIVDSGQWKIENGVYHQTDTVTNGSSGVFSYIEGSDTWGNNFTIEVKLNIQSGTSLEVGVIYKWQDISNHFHAMIDQSDSMVRINNIVGGTWQQNQNIAMAFELNKWYDLKVIVEEDSYQIFVDGDKIQEYEREGAVNSGFLGLKTVTSEALFDDFKVSGPNVPDFGGSPVEYSGRLAVTWGQIRAR